MAAGSVRLEALVLFSHGSLLCGAGETLQWHARRLKERGEFAIVEVGFMNYSEPTFVEAVEKCAKGGASHVTVVPYFLVPGKFVSVDLPKHVDRARARWPNLEFHVAQPIGFDEALADALIELADDARGRDHWRDDFVRASDFCESDPQCPLYGTPPCPRMPSAPDRVQVVS